MAIALKQIMTAASISAGGYAESAAVGTGKIQTVKGIRIVNTHASTAAVINVLLVVGGSESHQVSPKDFSLGPGQMYDDDGEVILVAGNKLKITAGTVGGPLDIVVSGFERDQT